MNRARDELELVLKYAGGCELRAGEDTVVWSSDADADFVAEIGNEILDEDDVEEILDYLTDNDIISDDEAENLVISVESLAGEDAAEDENDEETEDI